MRFQARKGRMLPLLAFLISIVFTACGGSSLADKLWAYGQSHPEGFTLHVPTMGVPAVGIAVSYAATQGCHSKDNLKVVAGHALHHDGYVGGWRDAASGLYYFDSVRLFPEDSLSAAITFAREEKQRAVYVLSTGTEVRLDMPVAPDYSDASMWYEHRLDTTGAQADIFYVCSTETRDWTDEATGWVIHFADPHRDDHRAALLGEMAGVDALLNTGCHFYAPYYRQATMDGLLADTTFFVSRSLEATKDVSRAFRHFLEHKNQGRPFVLMGYSQGGFAVVELLKRMSPDVAARMVAAYVIGYKVTASDLSFPSIKPAMGETDTGVTVCYNSVCTPASEIPIISGRTIVGINPANWRTDCTPAVLCDTLMATLDTISHLVCVSGYGGEYVTIPYVGKTGNYHTKEIPFYAAVLKENILRRIAAWRKQSYR